MVFLGADVSELESVAALFGRAASQLRGISSKVGGRVASSPWRGPDSISFQNDWRSTHAPAISAVATFLETHQRILQDNANQQTQASDASGGQIAGFDSTIFGQSSATMFDSSLNNLGVWLGTQSPEQVYQWWMGLSDKEREYLINKIPGVLGNRNGIPYVDRDKANRVLLDNRISALKSETATSHDQSQVSKDKSELEALEAIQGALKPNGATAHQLERYS